MKKKLTLDDDRVLKQQEKGNQPKRRARQAGTSETEERIRKQQRISRGNPEFSSDSTTLGLFTPFLFFSVCLLFFNLFLVFSSFSLLQCLLSFLSYFQKLFRPFSQVSRPHEKPSRPESFFCFLTSSFFDSCPRFTLSFCQCFLFFFGCLLHISLLRIRVVLFQLPS